MASIIPRDRTEQVNAIIARLAQLGLLKTFKELRHLTNGTYEVILSSLTLTQKDRANINSYTEITTMELTRGGVRIEFDFKDGQQVKTEA